MAQSKFSMNIMIVIILLFPCLHQNKQILMEKITQLGLLVSLWIHDFIPEVGPQPCPVITIVLY